MSKHQKFDFSKLEFLPISSYSKTLKASYSFLNGYGCNIYMHSPSTNKWNPYEFELTKNGEPYIDAHISDSSVGYCNQDDICQLILEAEKL